MALNLDFTFPEKDGGLAYGNDDYTWDFVNHWPELTENYIEDNLGENLSAKKAGNTEKAKAEIKKVSKLSKLFLFAMLRKDTQYQNECRVAKDSEWLQEAMQYQLHIFEAGFVDGGWLSMYETTDQNSIKSSIGKAAEDFLFMSDLRINEHAELIDYAYLRDGSY